MSYKFSRRDFLKYSALTAVAVAGAGMLSGCEIQDPDNPVADFGKKNTIGTTSAVASLTDSDGKFNISIANSSDVPLQILNTNFVVTITEDGKSTPVYTSDFASMVVRDADDTSDHYAALLPRSKIDLTVTDRGFKKPETPGSYTMLFRYTPNTFEGQLSISWKTKLVIEDTSTGDGDNTTEGND